jgi:hypothetical protein
VWVGEDQGHGRSREGQTRMVGKKCRRVEGEERGVLLGEEVQTRKGEVVSAGKCAAH